MFRRILVPLDGSARAELILPQVEQLWKRGSSELLLVRSVIADSPVNGGYSSAPSLVRERNAAAFYLHRIARRLTDAGAKVLTRVLEGSPSGAILDAAER